MWGHEKLVESVKNWVREYFASKGDLDQARWRADEALLKVDALYTYLQVYYTEHPKRIAVEKKGGPECQP